MTASVVGYVSPVQCPTCHQWDPLAAHEAAFKCHCGYIGMFIGCPRCGMCFTADALVDGKRIVTTTCILCGSTSRSEDIRLTRGPFRQQRLVSAWCTTKPMEHCSEGPASLSAVDLAIPLQSGVVLAMSSDRMTLSPWNASYQTTQVAIPLSDVLSVEVGGPGRVQTQSGGGVVGGGSGLAGAAEGMAIAALLNSGSSTKPPSRRPSP